MTDLRVGREVDCEVKLEIRNQKLEDGATHIKKVLVISLRILAVCLLFAVCMGGRHGSVWPRSCGATRPTGPAASPE